MPLCPRTRWILPALLALAAPLSADVVVKDQLRIDDARVTGLSEGELEYMVGRRSNTAPLDRVKELRLDDYPAYERGMSALERNPTDALREFRAGLAELDPGDAYLKPLFQLRAAEAANRAGELALAIELWAEAVKADASDYFLNRVPDNLPGDRAARDAALRAAEQALSTADDEAVRRALTTLRDQLAPLADGATVQAEGIEAPAAEMGDSASESDAAASRPEAGRFTEPLEPSERAFNQVTLGLVDNLIQGKRYADALAAIDQMMEEDGAPLADLFARRGEARSEAGDHFGAALDYLRVPIHFPDDAGAFDATLAAARELVRIDQHAAAEKVLNQAEQMAETTAQKNAVAELRRGLPN